MPRGRPDAGRPGWSGVAEAYAETFAPLCAGTFDAVLAAAEVTAGQRVLDVGTGTGALAARVTGPEVVAVAADPDADMLAIASTTTLAALCRAALPRLPFRDGAFDVVLANFVVNHLPSPRDGVAELTRVASLGGRLVATVWPSATSVLSRLWQEVVDGAGATVPPGTRLPDADDFARTPEGLAGLLVDGGCTDVRTTTVSWQHRTDTETLWRGAAAGVAGIGRIVVSQTEETRAAMRAELDRRAAPLLQDGRLVLPSEAVLAVGTAP